MSSTKIKTPLEAPHRGAQKINKLFLESSLLVLKLRTSRKKAQKNGQYLTQHSVYTCVQITTELDLCFHTSSKTTNQIDRFVLVNFLTKKLNFPLASRTWLSAS